jgi:hypothetical protein
MLTKPIRISEYLAFDRTVSRCRQMAKRFNRPFWVVRQSRDLAVVCFTKPVVQPGAIVMACSPDDTRPRWVL